MEEKNLFIYSKKWTFGWTSWREKSIVKAVNKKAETAEQEVKIVNLQAGKILRCAKLAVIYCKTAIKEAHAVIAAGEAGNSEGVQHHMSLRSQTLEGVSRDTAATAKVSNVIEWWVLTVFIMCGRL